MGKENDDNGTDFGRLGKIIGAILTEHPADAPSETSEELNAPGEDEPSLTPQTPTDPELDSGNNQAAY